MFYAIRILTDKYVNLGYFLKISYLILEIKVFLFHNFQVCVTFTWKDAFDKGSLFGGSAKLGMWMYWKCASINGTKFWEYFI